MNKNDEELYDIVMQMEREDNLRIITQDEKERQQFGDKNYLDVALEASQKFNQKFKGTFDGPVKTTEQHNNTGNKKVKKIKKDDYKSSL